MTDDLKIIARLKKIRKDTSDTCFEINITFLLNFLERLYV